LVGCRGAVGEVDPRDIHPRGDQLPRPPHGRRSDRADELGPARASSRRRDSHGLTVSAGRMGGAPLAQWPARCPSPWV
jgi:hypothetical protein